MTTVEIANETLDVALVLSGCFVVGLFKLGVADKGFAVFAPISRLSFISESIHTSNGYRFVFTVDFQYSDMIITTWT